MTDKPQTVLEAILESGIDVHRCAAARALGAVPGSVPALLGALLDEDPDVRTDAATALGRIADASAGPALLENLRADPDSDVKKQALEALIALRHRPALPLLRKLAVERSDDIAWDDDEFYQDGWDSWVDLQILAIRGLGELGDPEGVPAIVAAMQDEFGQNVDVPAVKALARLGKAGAGALSDLYLSGGDLLRLRIARAVSDAPGADNPHLCKLVGAMLEDRAEAVRETAALGLAPDDARLGPLLRDPSPKVRAALLRHAGAHFPALTRDLIADDDAGVRAAALAVIADNPAGFDDPGTRDAVRRAISGDPLAAAAAARAWVALNGARGIKGLTHAVTNRTIPMAFRLGAIEALKAAGPVAAPHLLKGIGEDDRRLRLAVMTALAELAAGDPAWPNPAGQGLLAALAGELVSAPEENDGSADTRAEGAPPQPDAAARGDAAGTAPDAPAPADPDASGDPEARAEEDEIDQTLPLRPEGSTLDAILSPAAPAPEPEPPAPEAAPIVLSEAEQRLLDLARAPGLKKRKVSLESRVAPHLDVRRFAARLLGGIARPEVAQALGEVLDDADPQVVEAALDSLVQLAEKNINITGQVAEKLEEIASEGPLSQRLLALRLMGFSADESADEGDARALAILHAALDDADDMVRVEAVRALERRGLCPARFEELLHDRYPGVAIAAAQALARLRADAAAPALLRFACSRDGTYRNDIGRLFARHAPQAGIAALTGLLGDESQKRNWLVAIDALGEVLAAAPPPDHKAA